MRDAESVRWRDKSLNEYRMPEINKQWCNADPYLMFGRALLRNYNFRRTLAARSYDRYGGVGSLDGMW